MGMIEIKWNPSIRELRQFAGIWLPGFFIVVGGWVFWKTSSLPIAAAIWTVAFIVSLIGYLVPPFMRWIYVAWMVAAFPIGWTISHLILAAVYFLVLTPVGLLLRLMRKDPMERQFEPQSSSYWITREPRSGADRYFKQF